MGAACPSAGVAALNGSFVEFDGSGALGQLQTSVAYRFRVSISMVTRERKLPSHVLEDRPMLRLALGEKLVRREAEPYGAACIARTCRGQR